MSNRLTRKYNNSFIREAVNLVEKFNIFILLIDRLSVKGTIL